MYLKMLSGKWWSFCLRLNVLSAFGTNYILSTHEDEAQFNPYAIAIREHAMSQLPCKFGESPPNPKRILYFIEYNTKNSNQIS